MPLSLNTDQSGYKSAVDFLTDLSITIDKYESEQQQAIKDLCKSVLGTPVQTPSNQFSYKGLKEFFNTLNQRLRTFTPDKQKKIKDLCKMVIGPGLTDSQIGTTEEMEAAPKFSRSTSNEDLTQTKLIRVGMDASLKMLDRSTREASPEDRQKLRQEFKKRAQQIKLEGIEIARQLHFEQKITEEDFASLKSAEALIPERIGKLVDEIVQLTGNMAKCAVNVKNGKENDVANEYISKSFGIALTSTQSFIQELDDFLTALNDISQGMIKMTETSLQLIDNKKQALLTESNCLAIERSNLKEQKKANRTLSYIDRGRLLGNLSPEFPPVTGSTLPSEIKPFLVNNENLSDHFNALQSTLSASDEMIIGTLRKTMSKLVGDRHMLNDGLGATRGLAEKILATEERYKAAQFELQAMVNGLECFVVPLKGYKESINADLKRRNALLAQQKTTLHNTFNDLYKAAVELKKLIPDCTVELKSL